MYAPSIRIIIACFLTAALGASPAFTSPIRHGPLLALGGESTMTVVWTTKSPAKGSVAYGLTSELGHRLDDSVVTFMHAIELKNLSPGTRYFYRVISEHDSSTVNSFSTLPGEGKTLTFVVYGDTRTDHVAHTSVLRAMERYSPGFVVNTGDLVASNSEQNWDNFFHDLCDSTSIGRTAPYYATPGNHEFGEMFYWEEVLPANNPDHTETYYSFDAGGVHLISVNTEIEFDPGSPQYRWLVSDLNSPECQAAKFRIAFWHRPPYSTSHHGSDLHVRSVLCPLMEEHRVDLVFSGHDHCYERSRPIGGTTYIVSGGGGAPLYDFGVDSAWVAYKEKAHHFCLLTVAGDSLDVRMIRASDGALRDQLVLTKGVVR